MDPLKSKFTKSVIMIIITKKNYQPLSESTENT
jgi:hypothetical protein